MPDDEFRGAPGMTDDARPRSLVARAGWTLLGLACVVVGAVGIVVPGLPTTVFFIGAAASFSKSSPRLEAWVLSLPKVGPAVRDYRAGLGMPRSAKVTAIVMIVVAVGLSVVLVGRAWLATTIAVAGLVGIVVVTRVPTRAATPQA